MSQRNQEQAKTSATASSGEAVAVGRSRTNTLEENPTPLVTATLVTHEEVPIATVVRLENKRRGPSRLRRGISKVWRRLKRFGSGGTNVTDRTQLTSRTTQSSISSSTSRSSSIITQRERPDPPGENCCSSQTPNSQHLRDASASTSLFVRSQPSTSRAPDSRPGAFRVPGINSEPRAVSNVVEAREREKSEILQLTGRPSRQQCIGPRSLCEGATGNEEQVPDTSLSTEANSPCTEILPEQESREEATNLRHRSTPSQEAASNADKQDGTCQGKESKGALRRKPFAQWDIACRATKAPSLLQSYFDPKSARHMVVRFRPHPALLPLLPVLRHLLAAERARRRRTVSIAKRALSKQKDKTCPATADRQQVDTSEVQEKTDSLGFSSTSSVVQRRAPLKTSERHDASLKESGPLHCLSTDISLSSSADADLSAYARSVVQRRAPLKPSERHDAPLEESGPLHCLCTDIAHPSSAGTDLSSYSSLALQRKAPLKASERHDAPLKSETLNCLSTDIAHPSSAGAGLRSPPYTHTDCLNVFTVNIPSASEGAASLSGRASSPSSAGSCGNARRLLRLRRSRRRRRDRAVSALAADIASSAAKAAATAAAAEFARIIARNGIALRHEDTSISLQDPDPMSARRSPIELVKKEDDCSSGSSVSSVTITVPEQTSQNHVEGLESKSCRRSIDSVPAVVLLEGDSVTHASMTSSVSLDDELVLGESVRDEFRDEEEPYDFVLSSVDQEEGCAASGSVNRLEESFKLNVHDWSLSVRFPVPYGFMQVLDSVHRFKQQHKLILLDHLQDDLGSSLTPDDAAATLRILSDAKIVSYHDETEDYELSRFVVLSPEWEESLLSQLTDANRCRALRRCGSDGDFTDSNEVVRVLASGMSCCPLSTDEDILRQCKSMKFIAAVDDSMSRLQSKAAFSAPTIFCFVKRLLVKSGIYVPLDIPRSCPLEMSDVFFVPSALPELGTDDVWSFKSWDSWTTTLCHGWLFPAARPSDLLERITVALLRDLYVFVKNRNSTSRPRRSQSAPLALHIHSPQNVTTQKSESIEIRQILRRPSALLIKICHSSSTAGENVVERFVEIFVSIVDKGSPYFVGAEYVSSEDAKGIIVSGRGQAGQHAQRLWKEGYEVAVESVQALLAGVEGVAPFVACNECLARLIPSGAWTWPLNCASEVAESDRSMAHCPHGHCVDMKTICGKCERPSRTDGLVSILAAGPVGGIRQAIVLVGLWDKKRKIYRSVGSGFIVDKKQRLIVTAAHVLYDMEEGKQFGSRYFGLADTEIVIGEIRGNNGYAESRYFAELVADDIYNVDACILRIREDIFSPSLRNEELHALSLKKRFEMNESVLLLGYNQGGEGMSEPGKPLLLNRTIDCARGYTCSRWVRPEGAEDSTRRKFMPREEVVAICPNIGGHSGSPVVSAAGKVIGILSRADPADQQRCYLVPSSEIAVLVTQAVRCIRDAIREQWTKDFISKELKPNCF